MPFSPSYLLRKLPEPVLYKLVLLPRSYLRHYARLNIIRKQHKARIAFIMSSLPMWRIQGLYELLKQDSRFELIQAIYPFPTFSEDQQESAVRQISDYCEGNLMPYINLFGEKNPGTVLKEQFNPDLVFFPQPYSNLYKNDLDSQHFSDRLICYVPYAMLTAKEPWAYRTHLNNTAWRLYYQSYARKDEAKKVLYNGGRNIRVVGDPMSDTYSLPVSDNPWKKQDHPKKKVIWAPHFSIVYEGHLHRDSFARLSGVMWEVSQRFEDRIQFAFKPHPRLRSVLYDLPGWGKEKTDKYYEQWANGSNTQLETGDYADLFKTSDAMVHDCGSFSVEYHYTGKPVLFTTDNFAQTTNNLNEFGKDAILAHYQGNTAEEIIQFLESTVLNGNDPMKETRTAFREKYLDSPNGKSATENIYNDLRVSLGFNK